MNFYNCIIKSFWKNNKFKIRGVGRPKKVKTAIFFEPSYVSELLHDSNDESDDVNEAVAVAAVDDDDDDDDNENKGDDASDLEAEPTVPKASTSKAKASTVPKVSKKRGPRGPYKKNLNNRVVNDVKFSICRSRKRSVVFF